MLKNMLKKNIEPCDAFLNELQKVDFNEKKLKKILYEDNLNIDHVNSEGETFLHICLKNRKIKLAMWLLSNNISVDKADNNGKTPFDIAMEHQNHRIVDFILDITNIDIDKTDKFGRTLLQDAVILGDHEMAKILLNYGADVNAKDNKNRNVLYDALSYGNEEFIDYLLTFEELNLNCVDSEQNSIMHHNFVKENEEIAIKLIEHGADPTIKNKNGNTFLCDSALKGMDGFNVVETAIKKGCNINSRVADENSILIELVTASSGLSDDEIDRRSSLLRMAQELIVQGIDINAVNDNNENALFRAVKIGDAEQVSFLLASNIEVNLQNNDGETPLLLAAYGGAAKLDIVMLLLKHKADPTIMNKDAKTLFEVLNEIILHTHAKRELTDRNILKHIKKGGNKYIHVLQEILNHNEKDLNYLDSTGRPLFFMPLLYNSIPLFKFYKKAGLNIHNLNKDGQNLFFEYVLKVFEDENEDIDFQSALSILISARIDHNTIDETGWTVISKVIGTTTCNVNLFKTLIKIVRFNYKVVDKLGRTTIHTAVWSSNLNVIKIVNYIEKDILNTPDNYGILPVIYAALLGDKKLVMLFIDLKAKLRTDISISRAAIRKFSPLLKNLEKLTLNIEDINELKNMNSVISQVKRDFTIDILQ